jgi:hypothetical protein
MSGHEQVQQHSAQKLGLFDHLVGAGEQWERHSDVWRELMLG